jgi:hypothetical protein
MKIPRLVLLELLGLRLVLFGHVVDAETNEGAVNIAPAECVNDFETPSYFI